MAMPNTMGPMPVVNPAGRFGSAPSITGAILVISCCSSRIKRTPKIGPTVVPKPPMIIMPIYSIESIMVKFSALRKPVQWANKEPATPARKQPMKKASSL